MITSVFLLDATGSCTQKIDLRDLKTNVNGCESDPQLLSGLFTALISFAELTCGGSEDAINYLPMQNNIYYFYKTVDRFYVMETEGQNDSMAVDEYKGMLKDISLLDENEMVSSEIKTIISRYIRRSLFKKPAKLVIHG